MDTHTRKPKTRKRLLNLLFGLFCLALLAFLLRAPEETTARLPHDETHEAFHAIKSKKEADAQCLSCHAVDGAEAPLPDDHPPPYRCLFCHKRDQP